MIWKEKKPAMKVNTSRLQCRMMLLILLMAVPLLAASVQNGFFPEEGNGSADRNARP